MVLTMNGTICRSNLLVGYSSELLGYLKKRGHRMVIKFSGLHCGILKIINVCFRDIWDA